MEDMISKAESLICKIETATQNIVLFINASKTKAMHFYFSVESHIHAMNGDEIEKVDDFFIWEATPIFHEISAPESENHGVLSTLEKIWNSRITTKTKVKIFKSTLESILLYGNESWLMTNPAVKKVDGTYSHMLQKVKNVFWRNQPNGQLLVFHHNQYVFSIFFVNGSSYFMQIFQII